MCRMCKHVQVLRVDGACGLPFAVLTDILREKKLVLTSLTLSGYSIPSSFLCELITMKNTSPVFCSPLEQLLLNRCELFLPPDQQADGVTTSEMHAPFEALLRDVLQEGGSVVALRLLACNDSTVASSTQDVETFLTLFPTLEHLLLNHCSFLTESLLDSIACSCPNLHDISIHSCPAEVSIAIVHRLVEQCHQLQVVSANSCSQFSLETVAEKCLLLANSLPLCVIAAQDRPVVFGGRQSCMNFTLKMATQVFKLVTCHCENKLVYQVKKSLGVTPFRSTWSMDIGTYFLRECFSRRPVPAALAETAATPSASTLDQREKEAQRWFTCQQFLKDDLIRSVFTFTLTSQGPFTVCALTECRNNQGPRELSRLRVNTKLPMQRLPVTLFSCTYNITCFFTLHSIDIKVCIGSEQTGEMKYMKPSDSAVWKVAKGRCCLTHFLIFMMTFTPFIDNR